MRCAVLCIVSSPSICLASRPCDIHLLLLLSSRVLNTLINQLRQRHLGCILSKVLQVVIQHESIDIDLANTCLDDALCDVVWPFVGAMSNDPHSAIRLLLDRFQSADLSVTCFGQRKSNGLPCVVELRSSLAVRRFSMNVSKSWG